MNRRLAALMLALAYARGGHAAARGPLITAVLFGSTRLAVEVARTDEEHQKGLMDRDHLDDNAGMIFVYPKAEPHEFWMKNTKIPLSVAYLDDRGKVLNVIDEMVPMDTSQRYPSKGPARYAVEANKAWFTKSGVKIGDLARFVYRTEKIDGVVFGTVRANVETVDTPAAVEKGLMFRDHLEADSGMLFVFSRPQVLRFWMKNTRIPLSIAFMDEKLKVLNLREMEPFDVTTRHTSEGQGIYALEMNKGWFTQKGIKPGVVARFLQRTTESAGPPGAEAADDAVW